MTGIPAGKWPPILVGEVWPDDGALATINASRMHRAVVETSYQNLALAVQDSTRIHLSPQQGATADDLRNAFSRGEAKARQIAEKNGCKKAAYDTAYTNASNLQRELYDLAARGNSEIESIEHSKETTEVKVAKIAAKIADYQRQAYVAAANCAGSIMSAIQRILDEEATGQSAHQFAQSHGISPRQLSLQPDKQAIEEQVRDALPKGLTASLTGNAGAPASASLPPHPESPCSETASLTGNLGAASNVHPANSSAARLGRTASLTGNLGTLGPASTQPVLGSARYGSSAPSVLTPSVPSPNTGSLPSAPHSVSPLQLGAAGTPMPPLSETTHVTPSELMQNFNKGLGSEGRILATPHAVSPASLPTHELPLSHPTPTNPSAVTAPVHVPAADTPPPVHHAPAPESPPPPTIVAATPPMVSAATPTPAGPLPSYGADLRPPVSTTITPPTPPSSPPLSAAPGSAPVNPSGGHSGASQPAVVRQTPSSNSPPPSSSGLATQAVAATAAGAAMGTASANATAHARLQAIVDAVARQQPRLAWAAGDRADQTTVLTTDLASGWIPPNIDLPSAVTLLEPSRRRGDLEALLGEITTAATYTPVHHLPDETEPLPISPRPRRAPDIEELGWELSQAAQWRDGLPRLAHTLAKAASAGTGVLDSEVDLLRSHLATTGDRVLDAYRVKAASHDIGNWQLLAAIDALVAGDKTAANYHLAWFLAHQTDS